MEKHYSVKEAAKLLHVSTNTLYSYLQNGKLQAKRIGNGRFRIPSEQVESFAVKGKSAGKAVIYARYGAFAVIMLGIGLVIGAGATVFAFKSSGITPKVAGVATTVTPLSTAVPVATPVPTVTPVPFTSFRIALFNGTETVGATRSLENLLVGSTFPVEITARAMAVARDYPETILIDLVGNRGEDVMKLSQLLNIPVSILPEGEQVPENTDFLIIVGGR